jgi:UDP-glucose 4-epimerase
MQLKVFGSDYETPDGTAIRDYIHVRDLADAHLLAVERLLDGGGNLFLNLGTGVGLSVRDIIAAVEHISGLQVDFEHAERRPGDPAVLVADPGQAAEILGWTPRYSDLSTIVSTALQWHSKQGRRHSPQLGREAIA